MIIEILSEFGLKKEEVIIEQLHQGLINKTWKISLNEKAFIFQKINSRVFKKPEDITFNINLVSGYLQEHNPSYTFISPLKTKNGNTLINRGTDYFRAFHYVSGSHTINVVETAQQAYQAAKQFGKLTKSLIELNVSRLKTTIPSFHDLGLRFNQFIESVESGNKKRVLESADLIQQLKEWVSVKNEFDEIQNNSDFKLRVTHHDTKISNVLFNKNDNGICVIDLDTLMPGYFFSDVGDMMRTYLSPVSEEETDLSKIELRHEFYQAIIKGYYSEMKDELTSAEKSHLFYAGTFMIYMQALRFLTDYLNNDIYYDAKYPGHNLNRAKNQVELLKQMYEKQQLLEEIILKEIYMP